MLLNWRKTKLTIFAIATICILYLVISIYNNKELYASNNKKFHIYIVESGDTLWSIAKKTSPDEDPRKVVYEIRKVNGITPIIQLGQEILVPTE
jgi:LysM repeat protein